MIQLLKIAATWVFSCLFILFFVQSLYYMADATVNNDFLAASSLLFGTIIAVIINIELF